MHAILSILLLLAAGQHHPESRTHGLGKSCHKNSECGMSQRCLRENDVNGKEVELGFCVLPCLAIDAGVRKPVPGEMPDDTPIEKKPPLRCPKGFLCRDKGQGVPIDMCVKE